ncbi:hypothetical protein K9U39_11750 [Rhodoblastus acidophilus]|uniref:SH3b domain-containing protein n=1 Tax=Candidatus Rhodoblastus alkanivorans TaxID=2954117 RepID=A0ABS9Z9B4_9HYPH|nr:hypothetical protein [Candidatus Rhodoblastus alkanivorans]MCI4679796.1 hypothetical protein [Candidatus Rhodoblastus alkanivorans]MCI4684284.1 hypothetical protein [Candidatus Rhodoblastus alkanivorans]MDI4641604.1 hypothetical protein [Rhodoblastus acidophilus]
MQDLIPPSKPVPEPREPYRFYADERPEIEFRAVEPRGNGWRFLAASAAVLVLTLGAGWATADRIGALLQPAPAKPDPVATAAAQALHAAKAQGQELAALRVHVESLKNKLDAQARKSRSEEATIASLQKNIADAKANVAATASHLQAKLEKVQSEAEKIAQKKVDRTPTASIGKPLPHAARARTAAVSPPDETVILSPYRDFVLRDAGHGHALIEGAGRMEEVQPGDILPGGALVERIERHGQRWVVRTDRGYIGPEFMWDD